MTLGGGLPGPEPVTCTSADEGAWLSPTTTPSEGG